MSNIGFVIACAVAAYLILRALLAGAVTSASRAQDIEFDKKVKAKEKEIEDARKAYEEAKRRALSADDPSPPDDPRAG